MLMLRGAFNLEPGGQLLSLHFHAACKVLALNPDQGRKSHLNDIAKVRDGLEYSRLA